MRSTLLRETAALVLLICLVCPLVEMFDHWDHTLQTGNDTEYSLVALALSIGVAYSLTRLVLTLSPVLGSFIRALTHSHGLNGLESAFSGVTQIAVSTGPPPLALRI